MSSCALHRAVMLALALSATAPWQGCAHMNHTQAGTLMGTGMGAAVGSIVGNAAGNTGAGALIGGVTGAIAGNAFGSAEDAREERDIARIQRDSAILNASYAQQVQQQALTNFDLIRLAQSGVGEDVIINQIQTRGGRFDLTTEAIIAMKNNGVSDRVIVAAQSAPQSTLPAPVIAAPVLPAQPGVVIVEPSPPPVIIAPRPYYWGPRHHHWHHGPRSSFHFGVGL